MTARGDIDSEANAPNPREFFNEWARVNKIPDWLRDEMWAERERECPGGIRYVEPD